MDLTTGRLAPGFHRRDMSGRREELRRLVSFPADEWDAVSGSAFLQELADVMVESAIGCLSLPLALADGFLIDGQPVSIPLAVEEPSVVAAASFAARLTRRDGGFQTRASEPVMAAQVFLEHAAPDAERRILDAERDVRAALGPCLASLERRGGGYRGIRTRSLGSATLRVDILIDVRDSMGANRLNTAAETARSVLERASGGRALMAVLSNAGTERTARAAFEIPVERLAPGLPPGLDGAEAARRIAAASAIARDDPERAVTNNKGIMNGIASLALATMNDTRAVEAAAHAWASRDGRYRSLSSFTTDGRMLKGEIELPVVMGSAGGSVSFHPAARACLRILGNPDGARLCRIAAALGLAQNLAAVRALVTDGIQKGHMRLHLARVAWQAGARGEEARRVADEMANSGVADVDAARSLLELRRHLEDEHGAPPRQRPRRRSPS